MVQSSRGAMLPPSLWESEKSILERMAGQWNTTNKTRPDYLVRGRGTMPGSLNTARAWEKKRRKMMMLNTNT